MASRTLEQQNGMGKFHNHHTQKPVNSIVSSPTLDTQTYPYLERDELEHNLPTAVKPNLYLLFNWLMILLGGRKVSLYTFMIRDLLVRKGLPDCWAFTCSLAHQYFC
ncbi:uncharacterized protein VP01_756g7 [Puccinia sorghi]|uniref:Uncharacterized protein n=1 Tax=Puccinia sorghi TaxID=27349 RepID=A0A0L6UE50_9BASI|nr:uncharacterized protein VP01_756g7 [Puccinia sorghi]